MKKDKVIKLILIGRSNVGKSSLFNRVLLACRKEPSAVDKSKKRYRAIVADYEGVTRDIIREEIIFPQGKLILSDSPGQMLEEDSLHQLMEEKARASSAESDLLLFVCDGEQGLCGGDESLASQIHSSGKECMVLVNKMDRKGVDGGEFHRLGFPLLEVSALRGNGIKELLRVLREKLGTNKVSDSDGRTEEQRELSAEELKVKARTLTILGCPNAGKSTIANHLLKEERQLVHHLPGSTRDSIEHEFEMGKEIWRLIDTAGIRRRSRVKDKLEDMSVQSAIHSMHLAQIVLYIIDGDIGIRHQDRTLLQLAVKYGKGIVIALNKKDLLDRQETKDLRGLLEWELGFIDFAPIHFISAKNSAGIKPLLASIRKVRKCMELECNSSLLNNYLQEFITKNPPPLRQGRRSNLRYVKQTASNPLQLIIHGKRTGHLPANYKKFIRNSFSDRLNLVGVPLNISYRDDANPFKS